MHEPYQSFYEDEFLNDLTKNILLWVIIVVVLLAVFSKYLPQSTQPQELSYSAFLEDVKGNKVDSVLLQGDQILGTLKDKT